MYLELVPVTNFNQGEEMMKKVLLIWFLLVIVAGQAQAKWGDVLNNLKDNPALADQGKMHEVISKAQALATAFAKMPANSGKLDYIKAALPVLTQAQTASSLPNQTDKVSGLLDKAKSMMNQDWSTKPLTTAQVNEAKAEGQKLTDAIAAIMKNETNTIKAGLLK